MKRAPDPALPRRADTDAVRQRLLERARELAADVRWADDERFDGRVQTAPAGAGTPGDLADQAEQRARQALRDAEVLRDIDELRGIESALERIDAGTYGLCVDCAVPIAEARLQVQPAAARCVDCQERHERALALAPSRGP
jgi:RNA polymerase-binding transcription factor DksA